MNESFYIQQAQQGSQNAFGFLLGKYWDNIFNYQLRRGNSEAEAEDICIQTFTKAFDKIHTYNPEYPFVNWLRHISRNIHIDAIRQSKNTVHKENINQHLLKDIIDQTPSIEDTLIKEQHQSHLTKSIQKLPSPYKELIELRFLEEKSYKEISDITGLKLNTVKVSVLRAKKKLAKMLLL